MRNLTLAEKVRVKRGEKGLKQAELAEKSGLTQATISRIESGEIEHLRADKIKKLAKALDVTVDFLVGNIERMSFDDTLKADETAQIIFRGYEKLTEDQRQSVKEYVDFLLKKRKKR